MTDIAVGKKVANIKLPSSSGKSWKLSEAAGKNVVLYFYPKDMTSGCTLESQNFRDLHGEFQKANTLVFGISRDGVASHEKFIEKESLPFELLADESEEICKLFDVIKKKSMYGKKYIGVERSTFLIDGNGVLRREWRGVKVPGHAQEVLEAARGL